MSVARAREFIARARRAGIVVHEQPGWESRGNGQSSAYEGWVNHHTATAKANANLSVLINGRSDLRGPLCNTCGWADGSIGLIAAHPANHAGASGGWDTRPFPKTSLFNKLSWGHEIIYEGTKPMTDAQYRTAQIISKIGVDIWGWGDVNRIKFHQGTSITGKWDPGYAPSKTYDIATFRRTIPSLVPIKPEQEREIMTGVDIEALPYSGSHPDAIDGWVNIAFPCEAGANSSIIAHQWVTLNSAWGETEYELILVGPNQTLVGTDGDNGFPARGVLKDRQRAVWKVPSGCEGIALRYKNNGRWVRSGIGFPQRTK